MFSRWCGETKKTNTHLNARNAGEVAMSKRTLITLAITMMMSGAAIAAEDAQTLTLDDAQLASGKTADEVKAADANSDGIIDSVEFAALVPAAPKKEE